MTWRLSQERQRQQLQQPSRTSRVRAHQRLRPPRQACGLLPTESPHCCSSQTPSKLLQRMQKQKQVSTRQARELELHLPSHHLRLPLFVAAGSQRGWLTNRSTSCATDVA